MIVRRRRMRGGVTEIDYPRDDMHDIYTRSWFTRSWTTQELVIATEPIVLCGSKMVPWASFALTVLDARTLEEENVHSQIADILALVISLMTFWLNLWKEESFYKAAQRQWVETPPEGLARHMLERILGALQMHAQILIRLQSGLIAGIILVRVFQGQRPLDTPWILLPIFSLAFTLLLRPMCTDDEWPTHLRRGMTDMLSLNRKRAATEPRDKVFALYGILRSLGAPMKVLKRVDYFAPLEDVYRTFTMEMMHWTGSLDLLLEAGESGLDNCLSWVPDWRKELQRPISRRAAGTSTSSFLFVDGRRSVETDAVILDEVAVLMLPDLPLPSSARTRSSVQLQQNQTFSPRFLHGLVDWLRALYRTSGSSDAAFDILHSVNEFMVYKDRNAAKDKLKRLHEILGIHVKLRGKSLPDELFARLMEAVRDRPTISRYVHRLQCSIIGKRLLFKTNDGRYGSGTIPTQPGDSIALLAGLGCPLIVRHSVNNRYHVIGAAYIQGVMNGECWPQSKNDRSRIILI